MCVGSVKLTNTLEAKQVAGRHNCVTFAAYTANLHKRCWRPNRRGGQTWALHGGADSIIVMATMQHVLTEPKLRTVQALAT